MSRFCMQAGRMGRCDSKAGKPPVEAMGEGGSAGCGKHGHATVSLAGRGLGDDQMA